MLELPLEDSGEGGSDVFADQTLPPGESLKVTRVAFLFTDLLGSTAMYVREGDPKAYGWVREHFDVLFQAADRNHGVTVKTIGDAVMASFVTPADAFRVTVDVHHGIAELNERLGAHVRPCISVTLNGRLDYFGSTVNIAARISHLSSGDDVVLSAEVLADEDAGTEVARHGQAAPFETTLRGYNQHFRLYRLWLPR